MVPDKAYRKENLVVIPSAVCYDFFINGFFPDVKRKHSKKKKR